MKIFISWSGEVSHSVALSLRDWLPVVLPFVEPWVSSEDIPKGSRWGERLAMELDTTNCGIICVTPDNMREPWLHFEAGALSKSVKQAQVHPFLLAVSQDELGPLSLFQATECRMEDVRKLVRAINDAAAVASIPREAVDRNFNTCWPALARELEALMAEAQRRRSAPPSTTTDAAPAADPLDELDLKVLRSMTAAHEQTIFPKDMAAALGIHPERAKYVMEKLDSLGLLSASRNYLHGTSWALSQKGRAELVKRRLL